MKAKQVYVPTVWRIIQVFEQYKDQFVDASNCIRLTKLEEFVAQEYHIEYGTDAYSDLEDCCYKAYRSIVRSGDYNE